MPAKLFKSGSGLALIIPKAVAERYHLEPGVKVEIHQTEEGLFVEPLDVAPWFSVEWEQALDAVLQYYRPALEQLGG